jgi:phage gp29-like protein
LLEKAVRYVIILIITVFDPLAVLMIIAGNMSMMQAAAERAARKVEAAAAKANKTVPDLVPEKVVEPKEEPMGYIAAIDEIRKNDDLNKVALVDVANGGSISIRYPEDKQPVVEAVVEPVVEAVVEAVVEPVVEPIVEPVVEAVVEAVVEPVVEAVVEAVVEPVVEAVVEAVVEPVVEAVVEPVVEPVVEAVVEETVDAQNTTGRPVGQLDDILQTIKQYHNVRLDDAKRTIR